LFAKHHVIGFESSGLEGRMKTFDKKRACFPLLSGTLVALNEKGQTVIEYALVLVLITAVVVLMVKGLGTTTNNTYTTINSSVTDAMK
jgi:Flp pilus assembly pilin Flp